MSRPRQWVNRQSSLFGLGSVAALAGLVANSVVAARAMGTDAFSAYAAMVSLLGVLGTGAAGAMEQETARRAASAARGEVRPPFAHAGAAAAIAAAIMLVPLHWQAVLFGERAWTAAFLVSAGVLGTHAAAIARGILAGNGQRARLGLAIALTGVLPVVLGALLLWTGIDPFLAFGIGTVVGSASSLAVAAPEFAASISAHRSDRRESQSRLGLVIAGNLFLTANMVAVPAVLRVHVDDLTSSVVASLQIVVSLSRLSTLLVANGVSVVVALAARDPHGKTITRVCLGAAAFGGLAVVGTAVLAPVLLPLVFGPGYDVTVGTAALASLSVLFLNPAYILTGIAVARHRGELIAGGWAAGALLLALVAAWPDPPGSSAVLLGVVVSSALPTVIMSVGLARTRALGSIPTTAHAEKENPFAH